MGVIGAPRKLIPYTRSVPSTCAAPSIRVRPPRKAPPTPEALALPLARWFAKHARTLSFRGLHDPYAIWVSEIMAQQTRIDTVERYFSGFMKRFPNPEALAAAPLDAVLQAWSGLGYYRRAKLLHRGAQYIVQQLAGTLPCTLEAWRNVPGVGPYTAGAIVAIALNEPAPMVDGNVARVLSRVRALSDVNAQDARNPEHWNWSHAIIAAHQPSVVAQALMELGATVCTPREPLCTRCPIANHCQASANGSANTIPAPRRKTTVITEHWHALVYMQRGKVLLVKRPSEGLLAGMWCTPLVTAKQAVGTQTVGHVRHVFTHRIWELTVAHVRVNARTRLPTQGEHTWIGLDERPAGGVPRVTEKVLETLHL